jgi:flagellar basal-body rod protein FlgC
MGYFSSLDVGASALTAQRFRMDIISQNIANANTSKTDKGTPYRRQDVIFEEKAAGGQFSDYLNDSSKALVGSGVRVAKVVEDQTPFKKNYDPGNPEADKDGYVQMPNVDIITEMVNMISATRAYEANVTSINTSKSIAMKALDIGR